MASGWRGALHHVIARELHRQGIYRLGRESFGGFDKRLLLDRYEIDVVFDVGANVGGYARQLREFGYRGRIVSIEPGSRPFATLAAAAAPDPLWEAHRAGAGEHEQPALLNVASNQVSSSFLGLTERFTATHAGVAVEGTEEVEIVRLDRFADRVAPGAHAWVKLDVEGYELPAIRGGGELLSKSAFVEIEMTTRRLYEEEPLFYEVAPALYDLGFELVSVASAVTAPDGRTIRFDGLFVRPT